MLALPAQCKLNTLRGFPGTIKPLGPKSQEVVLFHVSFEAASYVTLVDLELSEVSLPSKSWT